MSPEPEIVSKKGKILSRKVNETHLKVTRPKSSKVTEKSKAERRQKGRPDEQDTASTCSSEKADCMNGAKIVSEPTSATGDSPKSSLQHTLVATMQAGFDQLTNILLAEKAQTSRKRPAISDSDDMSDSEEIKSSKAKRSRVSGDCYAWVFDKHIQDGCTNYNSVFITKNEAIYMTVRTCALNKAWYYLISQHLLFFLKTTCMQEINGSRQNEHPSLSQS